MKRALVAGGAGFVGSHLCRRLLVDGYHVLCVDNFSTGRRENIAHLLRDWRFELIRHDVTTPLEVEADLIFNLACPASPDRYQEDPVQTTKTCVYGAVNLLDLAVRCGAPIVQASTSEVYGDPERHPQTENYWGRVNPIGMRSCYDEGKRCAESLFFSFARQYGARVKVARIFNIYGPRMAPGDGRVVSNFVVQALRGDPITVYGSGAQTRSFCYVADLIGGLVALAYSGDDVSGPINLGNPAECSIAELARLVVALTASPSEIVYRPLPSDDPARRRPDISLAIEKLGWAPSTTLAAGLLPTIRHFRETAVVTEPEVVCG